MATDIKAPQFPESVADGTVATWHKQEGEAVKRDELLVDIETDKVVLEVVAPADGVVSKILAAEGDTVESQQVLGHFEEGASGAAPSGGDKADSAPAEQKEEEPAEPDQPIVIAEMETTIEDLTVGDAVMRMDPVSYTHMTLPTSDLV